MTRPICFSTHQTWSKPRPDRGVSQRVWSEPWVSGKERKQIAMIWVWLQTRCLHHIPLNDVAGSQLLRVATHLEHFLYSDTAFKTK